MRRLVAFGVLMLGLAACQDPDNPFSNHSEDYNLAQIPPVYCYRSLANADCYDHPLPGEAHNLIGYVGPAPRERGFTGLGRE